jgi:hypothetical protein
MQSGGQKEVRKVSIFGNKGFKSIRKYNGRKFLNETRKRLKLDEIQKIKWKQFIPGLFKDLGKKSRRRRK